MTCVSVPSLPLPSHASLLPAFSLPSVLSSLRYTSRLLLPFPLSLFSHPLSPYHTLPPYFPMHLLSPHTPTFSFLLCLVLYYTFSTLLHLLVLYSIPSRTLTEDIPDSLLSVSPSLRFFRSISFTLSPHSTFHFLLSLFPSLPNHVSYCSPLSSFSSLLPSSSCPCYVHLFIFFLLFFTPSILPSTFFPSSSPSLRASIQFVTWIEGVEGESGIRLSPCIS